MTCSSLSVQSSSSIRAQERTGCEVCLVKEEQSQEVPCTSVKVPRLHNKPMCLGPSYLSKWMKGFWKGPAVGKRDGLTLPTSTDDCRPAGVLYSWSPCIDGSIPTLAECKPLKPSTALGIVMRPKLVGIMLLSLICIGINKQIFFF